jgi:hypothetical protein
MTHSMSDVLSRTRAMIVANVVPRPPRSSYNLLNLRDCGSVGDLVYRVLDLVVDACGVVSCGERRTDAGTGRCVASVACTTHTRCVCRFRSDRVGDRERRVYNWRIALCETAWIDTEQNGHIRTRPTNVQTRAPRGSRVASSPGMRAERTRSTAPTRASGGDGAAPR